jgi:hypothetical protein
MARWHTTEFDYLPELAFQPRGWKGGMTLEGGGGKGSTPPAPDYSPMAQASTESAQIAADLGREQLAENKRQFEESGAVVKPIIEAQARAMDQAYEQGNKNYETFQTEGRPIQQLLRDDALGITSEVKQRQMDEAAGTAIADARAGSTQQMNQLARTGMRYGWSPAKMAAMGTQAAAMGAQTQVAAANGARTQAGDKYYGKLGDVYNTYSGLGSSAPSFYAAGTSAGSAAAGTQNQTAAQYINGMQGGANTIMQGQGQKIQGLGGILNAQTSYANANQGESAGSLLGGIGGLATGAAKVYSLFGSDRRLKDNIELVGKDARTGLNLYEFNYKDVPNRRFRGVMADEVLSVAPDAVVSRNGFYAVDYHMIGIDMVEVEHATA